jgi:DNA modification methylase
MLPFGSEGKPVHPTQKPLALMDYVVRTYTNEGETVLDNTMGSGTTGLACAIAGRRFIGIEKEQAYCDVAITRIGGELARKRLESAVPNV